MLLRKYETVFILRPELPDEQMEAVRKRLTDAVTNTGGLEITYQDWGKRRLAYPLKKSPKGNYMYFRYLGEGATVLEFERHLKVMDDVLRYLTVKLDERVESDTFDFETDKMGIYPFNVKPKIPYSETEAGKEAAAAEAAEAAKDGKGEEAPAGEKGVEAPAEDKSEAAPAPAEDKVEAAPEAETPAEEAEPVEQAEPAVDPEPVAEAAKEAPPAAEPVVEEAPAPAEEPEAEVETKEE